MIVTAEDREPSTPAPLSPTGSAATSSSWSDADVRTAHLRLFAVLGSDAHADGLATAVLTAWATRRKPVQYLTGYLASLDDHQLLDERSVCTVLAKAGKPRSKPGTRRPEWCGDCDKSPTRLHEDDDRPAEPLLRLPPPAHSRSKKPHDAHRSSPHTPAARDCAAAPRSSSSETSASRPPGCGATA